MFNVLQPLYNLLKKESKFIWDEHCEKAFIKIKQIITQHPVLRIFNPKEQCHLYTDASKLGIGAVVKQKDSEEELHPIAYFSKKLLPFQQNYRATQLECLAIVDSISYWHHYFYQSNFTVITDHQALKYLHTFKIHNSKLIK